LGLRLNMNISIIQYVTDYLLRLRFKTSENGAVGMNPLQACGLRLGIFSNDYSDLFKFNPHPSGGGQLFYLKNCLFQSSFLTTSNYAIIYTALKLNEFLTYL